MYFQFKCLSTLFQFFFHTFLYSAPGDRVKYVGPSIHVEADKRWLSNFVFCTII